MFSGVRLHCVMLGGDTYHVWSIDIGLRRSITPYMQHEIPVLCFLSFTPLGSFSLHVKDQVGHRLTFLIAVIFSILAFQFLVILRSKLPSHSIFVHTPHYTMLHI